MALGECTRRNPGDLQPQRRPDVVVPHECLQPGVRDRLRDAARPLRELRHGVPSEPAFGASHQAVHSGVRGIRRDPHGGYASEACRSNSR